MNQDFRPDPAPQYPYMQSYHQMGMHPYAQYHMMHHHMHHHIHYHTHHPLHHSMHPYGQHYWQHYGM